MWASAVHQGPATALHTNARHTVSPETQELKTSAELTKQCKAHVKAPATSPNLQAAQNTFAALLETVDDPVLYLDHRAVRDHRAAEEQDTFKDSSFPDAVYISIACRQLLNMLDTQICQCHSAHIGLWRLQLLQWQGKSTLPHRPRGSE